MCLGAGALRAERPQPVRHPGENHCDGDGDRFCDHRRVAREGNQAGVGQQVEQADVDDVGAQTDDTKASKFDQPLSEGLSLEEALNDIAR